MKRNRGIGKTAKLYFEAFHAGRIDEVLGYFSDGGVVRYGTEPEKPAQQFFRETRDLIAQVRFDTHGIYTSGESNKVIIHFSFTMPFEKGAPKVVEAIDVIEFDEGRR